MHRIILTPFMRDLIQNLRGKYKGKKLLAALAAEKKREEEVHTAGAQAGIIERR